MEALCSGHDRTYTQRLLECGKGIFCISARNCQGMTYERETL